MKTPHPTSDPAGFPRESLDSDTKQMKATGWASAQLLSIVAANAIAKPDWLLTATASKNWPLADRLTENHCSSNISVGGRLISASYENAARVAAVLDAKDEEYERLSNAQSNTRAALEAMVAAFKPFTMKPMGAPGSAARFEQEAQIEAYREGPRHPLPAIRGGVMLSSSRSFPFNGLPLGLRMDGDCGRFFSIRTGEPVRWR